MVLQVRSEKGPPSNSKGSTSIREGSKGGSTPLEVLSASLGVRQSLDKPDGPPPAGTRQEVIALAEGDVTITFPDNLSPTSYEDLESYFELFLRKAKRLAEAQQELKKLLE